MSKLKYDTNEYIHETETDLQTQRIDLWGMGVGKMYMEVWGQQIQAILYIMDKHATVQQRELYSIFYDKMEKNI